MGGQVQTGSLHRRMVGQCICTFPFGFHNRERRCKSLNLPGEGPREESQMSEHADKERHSCSSGAEFHSLENALMNIV